MPVQIRDQWETFTNLEVTLRTVFELEWQQPMHDLSALFGEADSSDAAEYHDGLAGFSDVPEYKGKIEYVNNEELWKQTYTHTEYADGLAVERRLIDDEKYNLINRNARLFARSYVRTVLRAQASVFNNAFSASYTGADSVALCSANHDYSPTDTTEQSNYNTYALTHDNVVTVREAMLGFVDPASNEFPVVPDAIIVPTELLDEARVITGSDGKSGTALNDQNTNMGLRVLWSPYLTDANAWFMVDTSLAPMFLNWYWRVRPEFAADPTSIYDLQWRYRGYMRYSYGWDDYRWIYGCNPS